MREDKKLLESFITFLGSKCIVLSSYSETYLKAVNKEKLNILIIEFILQMEEERRISLKKMMERIPYLIKDGLSEANFDPMK